jgi:hypothetical protein
MSNTYNDVYLNATNYSGTSGGTGSITIEAQFQSVAGNDYHLKSSSPCINAGDPNSPKDPDGSTAEVGAFIYYGQAAYTTMVGSAGAWSWAYPTSSDMVPSGMPSDWMWRYWSSQSGRKVPQGTADNWSWGAE